MPHPMNLYHERGAGHPNENRKKTDYYTYIPQALMNEDNIEESNALVLRTLSGP